MNRLEIKALELYPEGSQSIRLRNSQKWLRTKLRHAFIDGYDFAHQEAFEKEAINVFQVSILEYCTYEQMMELRDWLNTYDEKLLK